MMAVAHLGCQRQPVGQHQATLGVGVEDLDALAVLVMSTSPGLIARRPACSR